MIERTQVDDAGRPVARLVVPTWVNPDVTGKDLHRVTDHAADIDGRRSVAFVLHHDIDVVLQWMLSIQEKGSHPVYDRKLPEHKENEGIDPGHQIITSSHLVQGATVQV